MKVTLPDGSPLELPDGATGTDAARAIGEGQARFTVSVTRRGGAARRESVSLRVGS